MLVSHIYPHWEEIENNFDSSYLVVTTSFTRLQDACSPHKPIVFGEVKELIEKKIPITLCPETLEVGAYRQYNWVRANTGLKYPDSDFPVELDLSIFWLRRIISPYEDALTASCDCTTITLMRSGCICGHIKKYKVPR